MSDRAELATALPRGRMPVMTAHSPLASQPPSPTQQSTFGSKAKRRFTSYRLRGEHEKPWLTDPRMKKTAWNNRIIQLFILLGFGLAALACYFMVSPFWPKPYCLVFEDNFEELDTSVWTHHVQIDGFGTGSFDWTTTDPKNAFVDSEGLHIVPTFTNETTEITNDDMWDGYSLNLTKGDRGDGKCTGDQSWQCEISSDPINGTMIPPIRSARLSTKGKKGIRYGRVEVTAKLPKGDWIWPAIWMMPTNSAYGVWPRSGEIDIMESRGNGLDYPMGGRNWYSGTLHWGPTSNSDAYWRTGSAKKLRRGDYSEDFHTYGIEWTDKYIYFYLDSRVLQIQFTHFDPKDDLWTRGEFAGMSENQTLFVNPWADSTSTTGNAPFDQEFYLILNVAVGSKNGWFKDNEGGKPWIDDAANAQWTFWSKASEWLPTWGEGNDRGMTVRSVKMWQAGECGAGDL